MFLTDHHDMTLAVKVALNPHTTNLTLYHIFDESELEAFVDNKINVNQKAKFAQGRVEKIVGKGENAG